jgi:hypothetical protein
MRTQCTFASVGGSSEDRSRRARQRLDAPGPFHPPSTAAKEIIEVALTRLDLSAVRRRKCERQSR